MPHIPAHAWSLFVLSCLFMIVGGMAWYVVCYFWHTRGQSCDDQSTPAQIPSVVGSQTGAERALDRCPDTVPIPAGYRMCGPDELLPARALYYNWLGHRWESCDAAHIPFIPCKDVMFAGKPTAVIVAHNDGFGYGRGGRRPNS